MDIRFIGAISTAAISGDGRRPKMDQMIRKNSE